MGQIVRHQGMESVNIKMSSIDKETLSNSGVSIVIGLNVKVELFCLQLGSIISNNLFLVSEYG